MMRRIIVGLLTSLAFTGAGFITTTTASAAERTSQIEGGVSNRGCTLTVWTRTNRTNEQNESMAEAEGVLSCAILAKWEPTLLDVCLQRLGRKEGRPFLYAVECEESPHGTAEPHLYEGEGYNHSNVTDDPCNPGEFYRVVAWVEAPNGLDETEHWSKYYTTDYELCPYRSGLEAVGSHEGHYFYYTEQERDECGTARPNHVGHVYCGIEYIVHCYTGGCSEPESVEEQGLLSWELYYETLEAPQPTHPLTYPFYTLAEQDNWWEVEYIGSETKIIHWENEEL